MIAIRSEQYGENRVHPLPSLREDTVLKNFPLFCPKCKSECLIDIEQLDLRLALWEYRRY